MSFLLDLLILFFIELAEGSLIKGDSFKEAIIYLNEIFKTQKIKFILMHTSLVYVLFLVSFYKIKGIGVTLVLVFKGLDLLIKLKILFNQVYQNNLFDTAPDIKIDNHLRYAGAFIYPLMIFISLY